MTERIDLSLDAMGGDHGPEVVIGGAELALERQPDLRLRLYGDRSAVEPVLRQHRRVAENAVFEHTDVTVAMHDKPSQALRRGRYKSSMWRAIQAVRDHQAHACVSAGNTGALMAMSKFCLKAMPGIQRPAIAALWPTLRGESVVLDVGATIGAESHMLVDFAIMGGAMARAVLGIERPTVGLLNVGVEEVKGVEEVRQAGALLREAALPTIDYHGFVEGNDLGKGTVDVVVTEGFAGNIALKTAEGTARQFAEYLRAAMGRTLMARMGYILAKGAFDQLREKMDPRKVNGGVFLGLNGIVIKSHGGTDAEGMASAIGLAAEMARFGLIEQISESLRLYQTFEGGIAGETVRAVNA